MELISPILRTEFREICVNFTLRTIDNIFQMSGIKRSTISPNRNMSGERRRRVEEYYTSIDWANSSDVQKFLRVIGLALSQTYNISEEDRVLIRDLCVQEKLSVSGNQIQLNDLFEVQFPVGLPFGIQKPVSR